MSWQIKKFTGDLKINGVDYGKSDGDAVHISDSVEVYINGEKQDKKDTPIIMEPPPIPGYSSWYCYDKQD